VAGISDSIRAFLRELSKDELEERVVEYVVREIGNGRRLDDVLRDPYVRNRLSEQKLRRVLENPGVMEALEQSISSAFENKDFGFRQ
jgi:DNA anti-recombination protein RmuC